jgi:DNA polymerase elongation subunit (family B)
MQIKELAEGMDFQVLHGIVDCLWVIGEPIASFKEAVERETGILTKVETPTTGSPSCPWPMAQGPTTVTSGGLTRVR